MIRFLALSFSFYCSYFLYSYGLEAEISFVLLNTVVLTIQFHSLPLPPNKTQDYGFANFEILSTHLPLGIYDSLLFVAPYLQAGGIFMEKRIYIGASLLHQCQREKKLGALDALAFCVRVRFIHFKPIIYRNTNIEKMFGISTARKQRILDNCKRLGLIRQTKRGHFELLPLCNVGECKIPVDLPYNVCETKITEISNILSVSDLANQLRIVRRKTAQRGTASEKGCSGRQNCGKRKGTQVSYAKLAEMMNVSERTVIKYMNDAVKNGLIKKKHVIDVFKFNGYFDIKTERENYDGDGFIFLKGKTVCIQHCNTYAVKRNRYGKIFSFSTKKSSKKNASYHKRGCKKVNYNTSCACACVCTCISVDDYLSEEELYRKMGALAL